MSLLFVVAVVTRQKLSLSLSLSLSLNRMFLLLSPDIFLFLLVKGLIFASVFP